MHFRHLTLLLLPLLPLATPTTVSPADLKKTFQNGVAAIAADNGLGDIYVCQNKNFGGVCRLLKSVVNKCENLPNDLSGTLTSIKPYKNQMCRFFAKKDCFGDSDWMRWPGSKNMRGRRFDNRAVSWQCTEDNCSQGGKGGCSENEDGTPKKKREL